MRTTNLNDLQLSLHRFPLLLLIVSRICHLNVLQQKRFCGVQLNVFVRINLESKGAPVAYHGQAHTALVPDMGSQCPGILPLYPLPESWGNGELF